MDATTTTAAEFDVTLHERAGVEHTMAEHALVNLRKFCPTTVIMLPGKDFAGTTPPKLMFVDALGKMMTPLVTRTEMSFEDCKKITSMLQFPAGIVELSTKTI